MLSFCCSQSTISRGSLWYRLPAWHVYTPSHLHSSFWHSQCHLLGQKLPIMDCDSGTFSEITFVLHPPSKYLEQYQEAISYMFLVIRRDKLHSLSEISFPLDLRTPQKHLPMCPPRRKLQRKANKLCKYLPVGGPLEMKFAAEVFHPWWAVSYCSGLNSLWNCC